MKKIILYIVLLSYTVVMLKPVLPYVSDFIGHVFFYTQHMATVHVVNGKMHIHKEITDYAKKDASQKQLPSSKKENSANDHISLQQKEHTPLACLKKSDQISFASALIYNCLSGDFPPPRA